MRGSTEAEARATERATERAAEKATTPVLSFGNIGWNTALATRELHVVAPHFLCAHRAKPRRNYG